VGAREYRRQLELEIAGDPKVRIGDAAEVDGFEDEKVNGKYEITEVGHTLDKRTGFRSRLRCERGPQ
jgi:phage protein D